MNASADATAASSTGGTTASAAAAAAASTFNDAASPLYRTDPWSNASDYYESLDLSFDDIADLADAGTVASAASARGAAAAAASPDHNDELLYPTCKGNQGGKTDSSLPSVEESYILGTLIVRVVTARNLSSVDSPGLARAVGGILFGGGGGTGARAGGSGGGSVNPYASVRFGATTQRTSQVFGTSDPVWPRAEAMYLDVVHPPPEGNRSHAGDSDPASSEKATESKDRRGRASSLSSSRLSPVEESNQAVADWASVDPPVLTVGIFHSNADTSLKKQKYTQGDSNDVFLGMATVNLTHLLTGKSRFDEWLPLQGGPSTASSSQRSSVRLVCEYEPSDPPPHKGDVVKFTRFKQQRESNCSLRLV
jgi:hypothetical protein